MDQHNQSTTVPRAPITKILEFSFSTGGHFEKWPKHAVGPNYFTGNMWNLNQMSPLNKMIPLVEFLGWGCMGGAIGAHERIVHTITIVMNFMINSP